MGQLFNETGKLISEQKEITGVNTKVQRFYVDVARLTRSPTPKPTSSPTLCSVWDKWEMILLQPGRAKLNGILKTITSRT